jgi:hypothetical protein
MKYSKFIAEGLTEKVEVPEDWIDVPFHKYPKFLRLCEEGKNGRPDPKEVFKLFFGLSQEMVDSDFDLKMLHSMNEQLNFLSTDPNQTKVATHLKIDSVLYRVPSSVSEMKLGKYRDIVETGTEILTGRTESVVDLLETYAEIIAIFIAKEGYTQTDLDDLKEKVETLPTPEIISLGNFFMNQFENLRSNTSKNWFKVEKKTTAIRKRALMKSVKILVI